MSNNHHPQEGVLTDLQGILFEGNKVSVRMAMNHLMHEVSKPELYSVNTPQASTLKLFLLCYAAGLLHELIARFMLKGSDPKAQPEELLHAALMVHCHAEQRNRDPETLRLPHEEALKMLRSLGHELDISRQIPWELPDAPQQKA